MAKKSAEERRRRAAELKEQRRKEERRRKLFKIAGISTAAVLVVGVLIVAIVMEARSRVIPGVEEYEIESTTHVDPERVDYEQSPPVGGEHWSSWQDCGIYNEPVLDELAVHSLEHGAVWITYEPDLPQEEVDALVDLYNPGDYLVISPYEGEMDAPIVASSWGRQLTAETADDSDLENFLQLYEQNNDVPEPGGLCSQGETATAAEIEAQFEGGAPPGEEEAPEEGDPEDGDDEGDEENGNDEQ